VKHVPTSLKLVLLTLESVYLILTAFGPSVIYGGKPGNDFAGFYNSGHLLLNHVNPYLDNTPLPVVPVVLRDRIPPAAYPPHFYSIALGLALMPYNAARSLFDAVNLAAIAILAWGTTLLLWPGHRLTTAIVAKDAPAPVATPNWRRHWWIIVAILLGQPFTSYTLWLGQTSLCIFALLVWAWWFEMRGDWRRGGVLLGIATCNPPLALLPIVWLLCDRRFKVLGVGLVTALVMAIPVLYVLGPLNAFRSWYDSLAIYNVYDVNVPGHREVFGIRSVFVAAGFPMIDLTVIGMAFAGVIWFFRSRLTDAEMLALLVIGGLLTLNAHTYTLAGLIITVPVLCRHADQRGWVTPAALVLGALILMPRRVFRGLGAPDLLLHWRVAVVFGLALLIIALVISRERGKTITYPSATALPS
jgi:hypothetical protein